jgi:AcrR family transcriptional regulator
MIAEEGAETLSLRKLARRANVSHNAPYQHFSDKEALLAAIAEEGFKLLAQHMDDAGGNADPKTHLVSVCVSYVTFAKNHAEHFKLMFGDLKQADYPTLFETSQATLQKLIDLVAEAQASGVLREGNTAQMAMTLWFVLHGIAAVTIADKIPPSIIGEMNPTDFVRLQINAVIEGLGT